MKPYIFYEVTNNGKYEYIDTNDETLQEWIYKAQEYYGLRKHEYDECNVKCSIYFKTGDFLLYILSKNIKFDNRTNIKIKLTEQYIKQCILNKKYLKPNISLSFIRDVLQIQETPSSECYASGYFTEEDTINKINTKNIKTRLGVFEKNKKNINITRRYSCKDTLDLIVASLFEISKGENKIYKCINCKRLFLNNSKETNTRYCNYQSPQNKNKTCFQYRAEATSQEVRKNNEIYNIHNSIYDLLHKRITRAIDKSFEINPDEDEEVKKHKEALRNFKFFYKEKKREYEKEEITKEDFINVLKEEYKKYREEKRKDNKK